MGVSGYEIENINQIQDKKEAWNDDYKDMQRFFIYGKSIEFETIIKRMEELQTRIRNIPIL
jgi:pullulanase/glycogen debranching enzyme